MKMRMQRRTLLIGFVILLSTIAFAACGLQDTFEPNENPESQLTLSTSTHALTTPSGRNVKISFIADVKAPVVNGFTVQATDMFRDKNNVFITYNTQGEISRGGLQIADISNPKQPKLITEIKTPTWDFNAIRIKHPYAYVVGAHTQYLAYMWVFHIANPKQPKLVGELSLPSFAATSIELKRHIALVTTGDRAGGIAMVDLKNPNKPTLLQFINDPDARYAGGGIYLEPAPGKGLWCSMYKLKQKITKQSRCSYKKGNKNDDFNDDKDNDDWKKGQKLYVDDEAPTKQQLVGSFNIKNTKDPFKLGPAAGFSWICRGFVKVDEGKHKFKFTADSSAHLRFSVNNKDIPLRKSKKGSLTESSVYALMSKGYYQVKIQLTRSDNSKHTTFQWEHTAPGKSPGWVANSSWYHELPKNAAALAVLSGNPGRLSLYSMVDGERIQQVSIPGVTKGITAPTRFDTDGKYIYINTNESGLHILQASDFKKVGDFQYPGSFDGKGNDVDEVAKYKLALVANGEKGLGVLDLTDMKKIQLLDDWDNPIDAGSANRVRLFASLCTVQPPPPGVTPCDPLFRKRKVECNKALGFLADGLSGLKIFQLDMQSK